MGGAEAAEFRVSADNYSGSDEATSGSGSRVEAFWPNSTVLNLSSLGGQWCQEVTSLVMIEACKLIAFESSSAFARDACGSIAFQSCV